MNKKQKEFCNRFYDATGLDIAYAVDNDMPNDIDAFMDMILQLISEEQVIYYHNAMEYLSEHDASLQTSLALAKSYSYDLETVTSETLATLLKQQNLEEEVAEYRDEIEELFYSKV